MHCASISLVVTWCVLGRYYAPEGLELVQQYAQLRERADGLLSDYARKTFAQFSTHYSEWSTAVRSMAELDALSSLCWVAVNSDGTM